MATAASSSFKYEGKTYRLSPLRDRDWGEFELWVQDRVMALAKRSLNGLSEAHQEVVIKHALEVASNITVSDPAAMKLMTSLEGGVKLAWLSLRREHPELTEAEVLKMIGDKSIAETMLAKIDVLNELEPYQSLKKKRRPPPKQKVKRPRPKRKKGR